MWYFSSPACSFTAYSLYSDIESRAVHPTTWLPFLFLALALFIALGFEFVNGMFTTPPLASNPLPPSLRKLGTVGLSAGPEIAIADENGKRLGPGETGEIVIRGENVMNGYVNNEAANAEAFTSEGYFRTGDQGVIDADGYLSITGRLKEIINRGGEKVSPREIDEVLMDHPCVAQCVCFAVPHPKLGEDVAVAIVLREATSADRAFDQGILRDPARQVQGAAEDLFPRGNS